MHFSQAHISASDLDWFIEYMIGIPDSELQSFKSKWSWQPKNYSTTLENIFTAPTINK